MAAQFGVLGAVEARLDGGVAELGHARQRCVLGVLLVEAGRPVSGDQLVERVWGDESPQRVTSALYSYLSRLRRALADVPGVEIKRQSAGYQLTVDPLAVDLHLFRRLCAQARSAESDQAAADLFGQALGLWRGEPFAGLDTPWVNSVRQQIVGERYAAELDHNEVLLRLGRHGELMPRLVAAVAEHPLDERLAEQAMLALYRSGRQADADEQYRRIRRDLAEELGSDPGAGLRRLHERILAADPGLDVATVEAANRPAGRPQPGPAQRAGGPAQQPGQAQQPGPAQLPADVRAFIGRTDELAALDRLVPSSADQAAVTIAVLSGTAGVGKSALAVRWAHRVREAFPDGQLYVNLRGYDAEQPVSAADALAGFLSALGVRGPEIPLELDQRAGRYRSELAGRRMLVLLDNASSVEQIRPLLPGTGSCLVLVTSRDALPGMVAVHGAERINLDLLPLSDAVGLLRRLIGPRMEREPDAAAQLAAACARLPLALRIAAELAAGRPDVPLVELVAELADHQDRLDLLDAGDPYAEVRGVLSWSYQHLPADAARAFRLLGLHPGVSVDVAAAAALIGGRVAQARRQLAALARASLVQPVGTDRFGMHDLLRAYAAELAAEHDSEEERESAVTRLFDRYLDGAVKAIDALYGSGGDRDVARRWLEVERPNLAAACIFGAAHGWQRHAVDLAATLFRHLDAGGPVTEAVAVTASAVAAAEAVGDRAAQARALTHLGRLHRRHGKLDCAAETYRQALDLHVELGDRAAEAAVVRDLGSVHWRQGHYRQAADYYQRALQLSDDAGQADALVRLGLVDERLGDDARAEQRFEQALQLYASRGDRFSQAYVSGLLARLRPELLDAAAAGLELSLADVRRAGDSTREAYARTDLAAVEALRGRHAEAAVHLREAVVLHRRIGDRASEAEALNDLGRVLDDAAASRQRHSEALVLAREIGDRYEQARAHAGLGDDQTAQRIFAELEVPFPLTRAGR